MMNILRACLVMLLAICLTACTTNKNVRGAYPTKNPNFIAGAGAGAVAGAATSGLIAKTKHVLPGVLAGAMVGAAIASYADSQGLINDLNRQGINIIRIGDTTDIIIPVDLLFFGGDTEFKIESYPIMDNVVKLVKQYGAAPITVTAHTDNVDGMLQRLDLSQKQAQSVTTYLWSHGINLQRIQFTGISNRESVADFESATGAGFNRRITISIWREDFRAPSPLLVYAAEKNEECWKTDNPDVC